MGLGDRSGEGADPVESGQQVSYQQTLVGQLSLTARKQNMCNLEMVGKKWNMHVMKVNIS